MLPKALKKAVSDLKIACVNNGIRPPDRIVFDSFETSCAIRHMVSWEDAVDMETSRVCDEDYLMTIDEIDIVYRALPPSYMQHSGLKQRDRIILNEVDAAISALRSTGHAPETPFTAGWTAALLWVRGMAILGAYDKGMERCHLAPVMANKNPKNFMDYINKADTTWAKERKLPIETTLVS